MKTYLKGDYGVTGSIAEKNDGTARLIICDGNGVRRHNKIHKNKQSAMSAWRRYNS